MNEGKTVTYSSIVSAARRKWLFLLGVSVAFALLAAGIVEWTLIPKNSGVDQIRNYTVVTQLPQTACFTSVFSVVLVVLIVVGRAFRRERIIDLSAIPVQPSILNSMPIRSKHGYFAPIKPTWFEKSATGRRNTVAGLLIVGIMLLASAIACFAAIVAAFNVPEHMKTVKLNGYTYHLAHQPTSDWDANEILLYECASSDSDCFLIHREFTRDLDGIDLSIDPETCSLALTIQGKVVFVYQPPSD